MNPKERIEELTAFLNQANYRYYVLDDPQMHDFEYDHLLRELEVLEAENPDLARVLLKMLPLPSCSLCCVLQGSLSSIIKQLK